MSKEQQMKSAMQAYIDTFNRADAAGIADLYSEDATVEDPVGSAIKKGKAEIAAFYQFAVSTGAKLKLAAPIRGSHGNSAAMAFDVELNMPQGNGVARSVIRVIDVMTFNDSGKFTSMRAFWGPGDMEVLK
jgi:steroid delta-isomerase